MKKAALLAVLFSFTFLLVLPLTVSAQGTTGIQACSGLDDKDNDGYGGNSQAQNGYTVQTVTDSECRLPSGRIVKTGDCFDKNGGTIADKDGNLIKARDIHPNATDVPGNGIDENCDGQDAGFAQQTGASAQSVLDNIRNFLTWVVGGISGIVLIIGGIMYATAAGEEQKTKRARKAMLGAVVGLVVALLSNVIISVVSQNIAQ